MKDSRASVLEKIAYKLHLWGVSTLLHRKRVSRIVASVSQRLPLDSKTSNIDPNPVFADEMVFVFWAQGESRMPVEVRACFESVKRMCGERRVVLLDLNNLGEWLTFPPFVIAKLNDGLLSLTHFSDVLRFCLLERFGGWWLDATVFLSNPLPNVNGLFTVKSKPTKEYISEGRWSGFIWHMPKGHPLAGYMKRFLLTWWSDSQAFLPDYFFIDYCIRWYYQNNKSFQNEINALTVSNPDLYFFQAPDCNDPFEEEEWHRISSRTTFFKTTYKHFRSVIPGSFRAILLTPSYFD